MTQQSDAQNNQATLTNAVNDLVQQIDYERERVVISHRFGINYTRSTLEQVGDELGVTRERVRQIEKSTLLKLKLLLEDNPSESFVKAEQLIVSTLYELGRSSTSEHLADKLTNTDQANTIAMITLIAEVSNKITTITENSNYYAGLVLSNNASEREVRSEIDRLVGVLKQVGEPLPADQLFAKIGGSYEHPTEVTAMLSISKKVANLYGIWGLATWPLVNPRNIRDKIYVILRHYDKPLHFSEIAESVKKQNFRRNNITDQAIHNELIRDKRFVLIGRGIYALAERGFKSGSIAEVITELLQKNGAMDREDIVRQVLKVRKVREATVLLNLQSKPQFKRTGNTKYQLVQTH